MPGDLLHLEGAVERPLTLSYVDLCGFAEPEQVRDVSRFHPTRQGDAVTLQALVDRAGPAGATHLTLHAEADGFSASVPLAAVLEQGLVVYRLGDGPLPSRLGGPFRFLIRDPAACHSADLDECANVKFVDRLEFTRGRGRDTRPTNESEHASLHAHEES